jgi:hypothetical protein
VNRLRSATGPRVTAAVPVLTSGAGAAGRGRPVTAHPAPSATTPSTVAAALTPTRRATRRAPVTA